jgi:hypothetical protein
VNEVNAPDPPGAAVDVSATRANCHDARASVAAEINPSAIANAPVSAFVPWYLIDFPPRFRANTPRRRPALGPWPIEHL